MKFKTLCCVVTLLMSLTSCKDKSTSSKTSPGSSEYKTMQLTASEANLETVFPISIKGQEDVEIRSRIEGFIETVCVDEGSVVKKGQTLFIIDSPQTEQALRSAKAAFNSAKAKVNTARVNVERIRPLVENDIVSAIQLETAKDEYEAAIALKEQAEAELINAQTSMDWTNVKSPVDGFVGEISFRKGSLVNSSNILTVVANTGNVYAYFSLNEKQIAEFLNKISGITETEKIQNIPEVQLVLADGTPYPQKGRIETISGIIDRYTGSVNLRAVFDNTNATLKSGTSGNIIIPQTVPDAIIIPQAATFRRQDKTLVYKLHNDSVFHTLISFIAMPDKKSYLVTEGLSEGDVIFENGLTTLKNGQPFANK